MERGDIMKLIDIQEITGRIILKSGLHIGAGDTEMHIGGTDNPVVKHPHNQRPYIPGSSIKGKVRSLLEMRSGLTGASEGKPLSARQLKAAKDPKQAEQCEKILKLFGCGGGDMDEGYNLGPTRVSFADCQMAAAWETQALEKDWVFTEVKSENSINRIKGTAENPRFTERVPAGAEFEFRISLKCFEGDDELLSFLLEGLRLLEMDALGGSGSRGYGRVEFLFENQEIQKRFSAANPM